MMYFAILVSFLIVSQLPPSKATIKGVCALQATVLDSEGNPADNVLADLIDQEGTIVSSARSAKGRVRFCDFGFGKHSLQVGRGQCYPVVITGITLQLNYTIELIARLSPCLSVTDHRNYCGVFLRIENSLKKPVSHSTLRMLNSTYQGVADEYGRVFIPLVPASDYLLEVRSAGYVMKQVPLRCDSLNTVNKTIVLQSSQ